MRVKHKAGMVVYEVGLGFLYGEYYSDVDTGVTEFMAALDTGGVTNPELVRLHAIQRARVQTLTRTEHWSQAKVLLDEFIASNYADGSMLNETRHPTLAAAYRVTHRPSGKYLIGATGNLLSRFRTVIAHLRSGIFANTELQGLWDDTPDPRAFSLAYTITGSREEAIITAQSWIDAAVNDVLHVGKANRIAKLEIGYYFMRFSDGLFYVGSTGNYRSRKATHTHMLLKGGHHNPVIARMAKAGAIGDISWEFYPCATREEAYTKEQQILDRYINDPLCVNRATNARASICDELTTEAKLRRDMNSRKITQSESFRAASSIRNKKMWSDPVRRAARKGAGNPFAKAIHVKGVQYGSVKDAQRELGIGEKTLRHRANDPTNHDVSWR